MKGENHMPNENAITIATKEFLLYLSEATLMEEMDLPKEILYHTTFKKFKKVCMENQITALKTMEYIAKNISKLDMFKVALSSSLFQEVLDYEHPTPFISNFTLGILFRSLILSDRYLFKSLNYVENHQVIKDFPSELKAWKSIDYVLSTGIVILSSSPMARERLRENPNHFPLIERMMTYLKPVEDIYKLYNITDHYQFTFLHPNKLLGFKLKVVGIQNNFHLFTLVQEELSNKARKALSITKTTEPNAISIAKGQRKFDIERKIPVTPLFDFYFFEVWKSNPKNPEDFDSKYLIKGSSSPSEIGCVKGEKIIIIKNASNQSPPWDTHQFKPLNRYLTSDATLLEMLAKEDVIALLRSLSLN